MKRNLHLTMALVAGALATSFFSSAFAASSPIIYLPATGHHYRAYYDNRYFTGSKDFCISVGGHLVVVNNHDEYQGLQESVIALQPNDYYWYGVKWPAGAGSPQTVTGQVYYEDALMPFNNHQVGAPSNQMYLELAPPSVSIGGQLNGFQWTPTNAGHSFVCEFDY